MSAAITETIGKFVVRPYKEGSNSWVAEPADGSEFPNCMGGRDCAVSFASYHSSMRYAVRQWFVKHISRMLAIGFSLYCSVRNPPIELLRIAKWSITRFIDDVRYECRQQR